MTIFQKTLIVLLVLASCGEGRIEREKLIGRYVWNEGRTDTLELRAGGTYEYWSFKPGRKLANSGTWKLNSVSNEVEFENENFPFLSNHKPGGSWFSQVKSSGNEICLMYANDRNLYLKQASP